MKIIGQGDIGKLIGNNPYRYGQAAFVDTVCPVVEFLKCLGIDPYIRGFVSLPAGADILTMGIL